MYLPKFKQSPYKYTEGQEYYNVDTQEDYIGFYFLDSKQQAYSGKRMTRGSSVRLKKYLTSPENFSTPVPVEYDNIKQDRVAFDLKVTELLPAHVPVRNDLTGYVDRFFAKSKVTGEIKEISRETYTELEAQSTKYHYPSYIIVRVKWNTSYPVDDMQKNSYIIKGSRTQNREEVLRAEKIMPGISSYLSDLTELIS